MCLLYSDLAKNSIVFSLFVFSPFLDLEFLGAWIGMIIQLMISAGIFYLRFKRLNLFPRRL